MAWTNYVALCSEAKHFSRVHRAHRCPGDRGAIKRGAPCLYIIWLGISFSIFVKIYFRRGVSRLKLD